jgi:restriction system protein
MATGHVAATFQHVVPFGLLACVFVSILWRRWVKGLLDGARANLKTAIASMTWRDFERVIGTAFMQQGFTVTELAGNGPERGVDLVLTKDGARHLVQCRHWRQRKVSVSVIRELYGVMSAKGAQGGYVITGGRFTSEARDFARDMGITLIGGSGLGQLIGSLSVEPRTAEMEATRAAAPVCPQCGSGMIERTATRGQFIGMPFWGCRRYPGCRGIVPLEQADAAPPPSRLMGLPVARTTVGGRPAGISSAAPHI